MSSDRLHQNAADANAAYWHARSCAPKLRASCTDPAVLGVCLYAGDVRHEAGVLRHRGGLTRPHES